MSKLFLAILVFERLRRNTIVILAAASDLLYGSLDLACFCTNNDGGCIARPYGIVYHFKRWSEDDDSEKHKQWFHLGDDKHKGWEAALQTAFEEASKNGILQEQWSELKHLLRDSRDIIYFYLKNGKLAKAKSFEVYLKANSIPECALQQKYTPEKQHSCKNMSTTHCHLALSCKLKTLYR